MAAQSGIPLESTAILGGAATSRSAGVDRGCEVGSARRADCASTPSTGPEAPARRGGEPSGPTMLRVKRAAELMAASRVRRLSGSELLALADAQAERRMGMWYSPSEVEIAAGFLRLKRGDARAALEFSAAHVPGRESESAEGYWLEVCRHLAGAIEVTR